MDNIIPPEGEIKKQQIDQSWLSDKKGQQIDTEQTQSTQEKPSEQTKQQPFKKTSLIISILKIIGVFVGVFIFVYLFLTFPAQYEKIKYWVNHLGKKDQPEQIHLPKEVDTSDLFLSSMKTALETEKPTMSSEDKKETSNYSVDISDLENNYLIIPKLNIKVPIIWNSPPDEEIMLKNLQKGVVHYNGTGMPDEPDGNVFISGHSSYYWWDKGKYKTVFANLNKLNEGNEIALAYEEKVYIYRVYEKFEVKPEQVEVLESVGKPIVTLMTCVPVGTNLRRLIVRAEKISENVEKEKPQQKESSSKPAQTPSPSLTPTKLPELNPLDILNLLPWRWNIN